MKLGRNLNKTFGRVYVKNLPTSKKRLQLFKENAKKIGLNYTVFKAVNGSKFVESDYEIKRNPDLYPFPANQYIMGNCYSGIAIHLNAMSHEYESYITCDDDTIFHDINIDFLKPLLPVDWDIIILGSIPNYNDSEMNIPVSFTKLNNDPKEIAGSHCLAIHSRCYNKFLMEMMRVDTHGKIGDAVIHSLAAEGKINLYKLYPNITYQEREKLTPYKSK